MNKTELRPLALIDSVRVNEDVVSRLEAMLEDARSGEITGIAYVISYGLNASENGFEAAQRSDLVSMVGELRFLEGRLIDLEYAAKDTNSGKGE